MNPAPTDLLWPRYEAPEDLAAIEAVPLAARELPRGTWDILERSAALWPDRPAITALPSMAAWESPLTLTFAELRTAVLRVAGVLARLGVGRADPVGVISSNTAGVLSATLAAQAVGIAAPVNPGLSEDRIRALVAAAGTRVLVAAGPELDPEVWRTVTRLAPGSGLRTVLVLRPDNAAGPAPELPGLPGVRVAYLAGLAAGEPADRLPVPSPGPDDPAAYFHTGGTTGTPKIAVHSHANEVAMAWSLAAHPTAAGDGAMFAGLPLFHVNALLVTCLSPLMSGRQVVWAPPLGYRDPGLYPLFWKLVERYRISAMSGVPTVYGALSQVPVDADISSLRIPVVGAAPLPDAVLRAFATHTGRELLQGYGLTEATCASAATLPGRARPGSVGQRLPYQRVKAVGVDPATSAWTDLPAGEQGTLVIAGPTVFAGYLRSGAPSRDGVVRDGWLDTGDHGRVDADGFVYLTGRIKDLIIRGGHNIDPAVIEETLLAHPGITSAAAVGRPDPHAGEVPVAYVTLRPEARTGAEELRRWAATRVPESAAAPKEIVVVDRLPVTDVGKVFKPALRDDAARRLVAAELAALGGAARLVPADGPAPIEIAGPAGEADRVGELLGRYALDWSFVVATAPASGAGTGRQGEIREGIPGGEGEPVREGAAAGEGGTS